MYMYYSAPPQSTAVGSFPDAMSYGTMASTSSSTPSSLMPILGKIEEMDAFETSSNDLTFDLQLLGEYFIQMMFS